MRGDGREQRALDLAPGDVAGVQDAALGMSAFARQIEFASAVRARVRRNAPRSLISSAMRAGPSVTIARTTSSSHSPAPASSVSCTWSSKESSLARHARDAALRPRGVRSASSRLVTIATEPFPAALSAKVSPAMPLPMTMKSNSLISAGDGHEGCSSFSKGRGRELQSRRHGNVIN